MSKEKFNSHTTSRRNKLSAGAAKKRNAVIKRESVRIALIYLFVSGCWILLTDKLNDWLFIENYLMVSIIKGLVFVVVTSAFIFGLVSKSMRNIFQRESEIEKKDRDIDTNQALLKTLMNATPDLVFLKNVDGLYLGCNQAFVDFVGKPEAEIIGQEDTTVFGQEKAELFHRMDREIAKTKTPQKSEEIFTHPDGRKAYMETLKSPYLDANNNVIGIIGISRDITERKAKEDRIEYLSYHDALTGLYNRTFLQEELKRLESGGPLPLSVIVGDVNGMKLINDAFGHSAGDKLLVEIAEILKKCALPNDIVFRIGGDEFLILLPNTDEKAVASVVAYIRSVCESNLAKNEFRLTSLALGNATKYNMETSFEDIFATAEDIMYRSKLLETQHVRNAILASIKTSMFEKSHETQAHAERLASLSEKLGKAIGLPQDKLEELELAATLHDIGKISIDNNILTKPGELNEDDWREIKKHPETGYRIANSSAELRHAAIYILCHHERWDGKGYPQGLAQDNIPLISRIIAIADSYDAMTHDRAYRKAISPQEAAKIIADSAGMQYDPDLVRAFVDLSSEMSGVLLEQMDG